MPSVLRLTDGTTKINLLDITDGYRVSDARQPIAQYKGGGTWQNSALADGRRLVDKRLGNVVESWGLKIADEIQDAAILALRDLLALLEKASDYWTSWQDDAVWIERRATHETNMQYAVIGLGALDGLPDPFVEPFLSDAALEGMVLTLEHGHWLDQEPGTGTTLEGSALATFDGRTFGNVDSTGAREPTADDEVFIGNCELEGGLTDIYIYDAPAFLPGNLLDAALPYDLLPAVPAVGDAIYFGSDTAVANYSSFWNLIFNISIAQNDLTMVWEYSNLGLGWTAITYFQDDTNAGGAHTGQPFDTTGVNGVYWNMEHPPVTVGWRSQIVNGVDAMWIRCRVTAVGGAPSPPRQAERDPYTCVWAYTEIQNDQFGGDLKNLAEIIMTPKADVNGPGGAGRQLLEAYFQRVIVGARSVSRGANFRAFINIADTNNPTGFTLTDVGPGAFASIGAYSTPANGRGYFWAAGGVVAMTDLVEIEISNTIADNFYGRFHAYLSVFHYTGSEDYRFQLKVQAGSGGVTLTKPATLPPAAITSFGYSEVLDLGVIEIPGSGVVRSDEDFDNIIITIQGECVDATPGQIYIEDLALIPVDEWSGDFIDRAQTNDSTAEKGTRLFIDSVEYPKAGIRCLIKNISTSNISTIYQSVSSEPAVLRQSGAQRLYFMTLRPHGSGPTWARYWMNCYTVQLKAVKRYYALRGSG